MLLKQSFTINYNYSIFFSENIFNVQNNILTKVFEGITTPRKILILVEDIILLKFNNITHDINLYFESNLKNIKIVAINSQLGGEICKNEPNRVSNIIELVNLNKVDRHSFIMVIGGGAFIDMVGYAATISHRGINLIRVPTTILAQNDAAIGVKNSINYLNKKNFLGTFSTPYAVVNDAIFLTTLDDKDWIAGMAEAVKVALIKDKEFFKEIENSANKLIIRDLQAMKNQIFKCADLHLQHIRSKDPFERGSSRPLDYGHWSAHKLEQLSGFELRHGEDRKSTRLNSSHSTLSRMPSSA